MSDDTFLIASLIGQPYTHLRGSDTARSRRATGAIINAHELIVATVDQRPNSDFRLVGKYSFSLKLGGQSQFHVTDFATEVQGWINHYGIEQLALRMNSANARKYAPSPFAFKIETILQLVPSLFVQTVNTQSVSSWVKREDPALPLSALAGLKASDAGQWKRAVEMAAYAIRHADEEPVFAEGFHE